MLQLRKYSKNHIIYNFLMYFHETITMSFYPNKLINIRYDQYHTKKYFYKVVFLYFYHINRMNNGNFNNKPQQYFRKYQK